PISLSFVGLAQQAQFNAARMRFTTARSEAHYGVELQSVIQHAMRQSCRPHALHRFAYAGSALVNTNTAYFIHALGSEQIGDVVPHASIDVIAIGRLQIANQT